jgi:glyoxylase-like metal-dependent hydrolase (beta-lactamase superfamily II)
LYGKRQLKRFICIFIDNRIKDRIRKSVRDWATKNDNIKVAMTNKPEVKLIEIKQNMPGFGSFFGSWVCKGDVNILIDTGPANSACNLLDALVGLGLEKIDYVCLTHVHIDHCGGLAQIIDHYPMAKVICHHQGLKHLLDPSGLWKGSLDVLGEIAINYGEPKPVSADVLLSHTENPVDELHIVETPGHAIHHLSFSYKGNLFAGEAGGNYFVVKDIEYLRPATPPRFFFDVFLNSVDRLLALDDQPICYVHCGRAESSHVLLKRFRNQMILWKDIIEKQLLGSDADIIERCLDVLFKEDPNLKAFDIMDSDTKVRERFFLKNSVKGFVGFLKKKPSA